MKRAAETSEAGAATSEAGAASASEEEQEEEEEDEEEEEEGGETAKEVEIGEKDLLAQQVPHRKLCAQGEGWGNWVGGAAAFPIGSMRVWPLRHAWLSAAQG